MTYKKAFRFSLSIHLALGCVFPFLSFAKVITLPGQMPADQRADFLEAHRRSQWSHNESVKTAEPKKEVCVWLLGPLRPGQIDLLSKAGSVFPTLHRQISQERSAAGREQAIAVLGDALGKQALVYGELLARMGMDSRISHARAQRLLARSFNFPSGVTPLMNKKDGLWEGFKFEDNTFVDNPDENRDLERFFAVEAPKISASWGLDRFEVSPDPFREDLTGGKYLARYSVRRLDIVPQSDDLYLDESHALELLHRLARRPRLIRSLEEISLKDLRMEGPGFIEYSYPPDEFLYLREGRRALLGRTLPDLLAKFTNLKRVRFLGRTKPSKALRSALQAHFPAWVVE